MAEAKKCDRCGKYFDNNIRTMFLYKHNPTRSGPLDLCNTCVAELKEWFDMKHDEASTHRE